MIGLSMKICGVLLVLNHLTMSCDGLGNNAGRGYNSEKYDTKSYNAQSKMNGGSSSKVPGANQNPRRGLGISAWGIVMVILTIILLGMGMYYLAFCYPVLCKKESTYDMIELANV